MADDEDYVYDEASGDWVPASTLQAPTAEDAVEVRDAVGNLLADYPSLAACGVDVLRLSPRSEGMRQVIGEFAAVRDGALPPLAVSGCNGYWHGRPGMLTVEGVGL